MSDMYVHMQCRVSLLIHIGTYIDCVIYIPIYVHSCIVYVCDVIVEERCDEANEWLKVCYGLCPPSSHLIPSYLNFTFAISYNNSYTVSLRMSLYSFSHPMVQACPS